jgi:titin
MDNEATSLPTRMRAVLELCLILVLMAASARGWAATYVVTTTANSGAGSFFAALESANTNPGLDTITFNVSGTPPFTITPIDALPAVTDPVVIDGTTQPGYAGKPLVQLNGTNSSAVGLRLLVGASTVRGLAINNFSAGALKLRSASNVIQGCFIGTDVTGTNALGNGLGSANPGIWVLSGGNLIGGTSPGNRNVIAGNYYGIYLQSAGTNLIQGNLIGVGASGTTGLGNVMEGIVINPGSGNLIGGPTAAARNLISGNGDSGIYFENACSNLVQGNWIGPDASGSNALANVTDGITLVAANDNLITSNLVSGNAQAGIFLLNAAGNLVAGNWIGTDTSGQAALSNDNSGVEISGAGGNLVGNTNPGQGNVISGNGLDGVTLTGGTLANFVQGNFIGLSAGGTKALPNGQDGIQINGGSSNVVGGTVAGARNVLSGNVAYGVGILQSTDAGNLVLGNYIGTDVTGTQAVSNHQSGVQIQACANTIGGSQPGAGNVISGNGRDGVFLSGANGPVTGNIIAGNLIGLSASGTSALGNNAAGVGLFFVSNNVIGGTSPGARNVISANGNQGGVFFDLGASGNQLLGNYIGTDVTGTQALGNHSHGVWLGPQTAGNGIGTPGAGNVISANAVDGIFLTNSSGNVIQANYIGTKADGTNALGNTFHNLELQANATNNTIGGTMPGMGNTIAYAKTPLYSGVRVRPGSLNNLISGNSIFNNAELGIDLGAYGVTPNTDCESGMTAANANFGQNYPTLTSAYTGASTRIAGTLDAQPGNTYTLQFFASPAGNALGFGEGDVYLGQTTLTLGSLCSSNFAVDLPGTVSSGWVITATATDSNNNTSEFSAWLPVIPVPPIRLTQSRNGQNAQISLAWTNNGGSFSLLKTASLSPPINWQAVTDIPVLVSHFETLTLSPTNPSVFYQLVTP